MDLLGESIDRMSASIPMTGQQDVRNSWKSTAARRRKGLCDYVYAGSCLRGTACKFKHFKGPSAIGPASPRDDAYALQVLPTYYGLPSPPPFSPLIYQPIWPSWSLQLPSPSAAQSLAHMGMAQQFSEPLGSDLSSDVSSCSEDGPSTRDPSQTPQYYSPGGNNSAYGYPPGPASMQVLPFSPVSPMYATGPMAPTQAPPSVRPHRGFAGDHSRWKRSVYKTKICTFYATTGRCTKGHRCTYIHERGEERDPLADPAARSPADASVTLSSEQHPRSPSVPHKDKDKANPNNTDPDQDGTDHEDGYYPINWRVIGGGVMMGGSRPSCRAYAAGHCFNGEDCPYAHDTELVETDDGVLFTREIEARMASLHLSREILQDNSTLRRPHKPRSKGRKPAPLEIAPPAIPEVVERETSPLPEAEDQEHEASTTEREEPIHDKPSALLSPPSSGHRRAQSMTAIAELHMREDSHTSRVHAAEL